VFVCVPVHVYVCASVFVRACVCVCVCGRLEPVCSATPVRTEVNAGCLLFIVIYSVFSGEAHGVGAG